MTPESGHRAYQVVADFYDFVGPYRDRPDVPFYVEMARTAGGPVLEVGCGTGRILLPVARAGVEVVGIDLSPDMLAVCRKRLALEDDAVQRNATLVQADMRDFALEQRFRLATLPFRSFQHMLTVEDQLACLRRVHAHLDVAGRVVLDIFNPSFDALANRKLGEEFGDEPEFTMPDGRRVTRKHSVVAHDRFNQINHVELIYYVTHPDGAEERLVDPFAMRYLFRYEAEHLLARCGFEIEHVFAGYDGSEYGAKYPGELVIVARRQD